MAITCARYPSPRPPYSGATGGPEQAGFPELGPEMARERVVTVDGRGVRRDLGLGEGPYGLSKPLHVHGHASLPP